MNHSAGRETAVGVVVVAALAAFVALLVKAGTGPGFLASRLELDVLFQDGQGLRQGSPVRIAGLDVGQVTQVDLAEFEGKLMARVRISLPADLVDRLKEDVRVTIQSNLTGQNCVNVVGTGSSSRPVQPGQVVRGLESTMFDPILKEVGLGPAERADIGHVITKVRQAIDEAEPTLRAALIDARATLASARQVAETAQPSVEEMIGRARAMVARLEEQLPRVEAFLANLEAASGEVRTVVADNRPKIDDALDHVRDLSGILLDTVETSRPKFAKFLDGLEPIRARVERVAYNTELTTAQAAEMLALNRSNIDRALANARDATQWAEQTAQKIYSNPFLISPFYKPRDADLRAQGAVDLARALTQGSRELADLLKTMDLLQRQPLNDARRRELDNLRQRMTQLEQWMTQTERQLAESLRITPSRR